MRLSTGHNVVKLDRISTHCHSKVIPFLCATLSIARGFPMSLLVHGRENDSVARYS
jgi:hypothetical protein